MTADRLYGKIEVDLLDQLVPYFRVKVGDMWLFDLDVSSILYSWTIRVAHLAKHLWTKTPHPFCRAILSKEGFLFGVRLFLPAGEVCSWRMAASLCACIEQSNKCTFVDLIKLVIVLTKAAPAFFLWCDALYRVYYVFFLRLIPF